MPDAPKGCRYCDGHGNATAGGSCGFCIDGVPRDTQADWDRTWGKVDKVLSDLTRAASEATRNLCVVLLALSTTPPYKRNKHRYGR